MLNIPNSIKALFKADESHKNFRVHFPGGEYPDITNDNIVQESVHFTESVCSQDTFKLGTFESSVLEFEAVDVPNLYGLTIEAGIEIDTSSLSAGEISSIQGNPGDGTLVLLADSDLGYGFYRIPLGIFVVNDCPRDHQAKSHRTFTCYSTFIEKPLSEVVKDRTPIRIGSGSYIPFAHWLVFANNSFKISDMYSDWYVAETKNWSDFGADLSKTGTIDINSTKRVQYSLTYKQYEFTYDSGSNTLYSGLFNILMGDMPYAPYADDLATLSGETTANLKSLLSILDPHVIFDDYSALLSNRAYWHTLKYAEERIYPWTYIYARPCIWLPVSYTLTYQEYQSGSWVTVDTLTYDPGMNLGTYPSIQRYAVNYTPLDAELKLNYYLNGQSAPAADGYGNTSLGVLSDDYDWRGLVEGFLEVQGYFARPSRLPSISGDSAWDIVSLTMSNPVSVVPGEYSFCWWNDAALDTIGTVYYPSEGSAAVHYINQGGSSAYNMTENWLLENLYATTAYNTAKYYVEYFFGQKFRYNGAKVLQYYPIDMEMQGWPWMQAGDYLEITTEDGETVGTYVMRMEIQGIQNLRATINSETGEVVEVE